MNVVSQAAPSTDRSRRLLLIVGITALVVVSTSFIIAARRLRTIPFSTAAWAKGKGQYTTDNPRLLMKDEVQGRINAASSGPLVHGMTKADLEKMLGPADPPIAIKDPSGLTTPAGFATPTNRGYVLGVQPKSAFVGRRLLVLSIYMDAKGNAQGCYVDPMNYPPGSTIVPAPPIIAPKMKLPKPKPVKPRVSRAGP